MEALPGQVLVNMTCNIDPRGRAFRLLTGLLLFANGGLMYALDLPGAGRGWRILSALLVLTGAFGIIEGILGWCALRALGFKTRL